MSGTRVLMLLAVGVAIGHYGPEKLVQSAAVAYVAAGQYDQALNNTTSLRGNGFQKITAQEPEAQIQPVSKVPVDVPTTVVPEPQKVEPPKPEPTKHIDLGSATHRPEIEIPNGEDDLVKGKLDELDVDDIMEHELPDVVSGTERI